MPHTSLALIGDYSNTVTAHVAIPLALDLVAKENNLEVEFIWVHSSELASREALNSLQHFDGIWCVPASPYSNDEGALSAIKLARTENIPYLGTCAGFQYALLEYFRNVIGMTEAQHGEAEPHSEHQIISRLSCSLVEEMATICLTSGSLASRLYGRDQVEEGYRCNYGFNPEYVSILAKRADIEIEGRDPAGDIRIFRLLNHPFFMATLFQPERSALKGRLNPLIREFVLTSAGLKKGSAVGSESQWTTMPVSH